MAILTSGVGFSEASGSVAGLTYARARSTIVLRSITRRTNPPHPYVAPRKAFFARTASRWRGFSGDPKLYWQHYADSLQIVDNLGRPFTPTGFQAFMASNLGRFQLGLGEVNFPTPFDPIASVALTSSGNSLSGSNLMARCLFITGAGSIRALFAGPTSSPGIRRARRRGFRALNVAMGGANTNVFSLYTTAWSPVGASFAGWQLRLRLLAFNQAGFHGVPQDLNVFWNA